MSQEGSTDHIFFSYNFNLMILYDFIIFLISLFIILMILNNSNFPEINLQSQQFYVFYYYVPSVDPISPSQIQNQFQNNSKMAVSFEQVLFAELQKKHNQSYIKMWTYEEDQKLLNFGSSCKNWRQFSKEFYGKSAKVCNRRFKKLLNKQKNWPRQKELYIKRLREIQRKSWVQIQMILQAQFGFLPCYSAKKIRERYKNYLQLNVTRQRWSLEQDIELLRRVEQIGKSWKDIVQFFQERSSLQIRNRYYKFLEPLVKKVKNEIEQGQKKKI